MAMDRSGRVHAGGAGRLARAAGAIGVAAVLLTGCGPFAAAPKPKAAHAKTPQAVPGPVSVQGNAAAAKPAGGLGGAIGAVIDNEAAARPQSGIQNASLVFEAPTEGGITRFLALFWANGASQIGPIRSARIYFDQLAQAYNIPLAHAGGNVDALKAMRTLGIKNIDQIWTPGASQFFWRSPSRQAPHNLYTSSTLLTRAVRSLGLTLGPIPAWPRGNLVSGKAAGEVTVDFSGVEQVHWLYANGMYTRYEGATIDDTLSGAPIRARAVLVLNVGEQPDPDPYTPGSIKLDMTGQGTGELAADGREVAVRWERSATGPFTILNAQGTSPQAMPAPPLWIELVPPVATVTFGS